jgi:hypothetical protein
MQKSCVVCSVPFEAKRNTAKYCSRRCSMRASRRSGSPKAAVVAMPADPDSALWSATLAELSAAGRVNSAAGQAVLVLARRIDASDGETGAGLAALVKQHGATLADAVKGRRAVVNPLDELRLARERRAAG